MLVGLAHLVSARRFREGLKSTLDIRLLFAILGARPGGVPCWRYGSLNRGTSGGGLAALAPGGFCCPLLSIHTRFGILMSFLLAITDFSHGEGVYTAEMVVALAPRLGYHTIASWDRGLHGWPRLQEAALEAGLTPILGCRFTWRGMEFGAFPHSNRGYAELCRLLTDQAHGREGDPPRDCFLLAETLDGQEYLAREGFAPYLFAHNRNQMEAMRASTLGLPIAAPQVLKFRREAGLDLHRLKRAIAQRSTVPRTEPLWSPRDAAVDLAAWEARYPGADPVITRVTEDIQEKVKGWRMHWGDWVIPRPICSRDMDLDEELSTRIRQGIPRRYAVVPPGLEARIELEMDLIRRKRFAGYFLTVHDIIREAKATRTCGRGSGAASIVSYLLGITNVDPLATNLMFERFLSDARVDPPDLDIDFAWDERDDVIASVFRRYGTERVAMVAVHAYFKPKSALRDVAMAYGRPEAELKTMARLIRGWDDGIQGIQGNPQWAPILAHAVALQGHFHQLSVHPTHTIRRGGFQSRRQRALGLPAPGGAGDPRAGKGGDLFQPGRPPCPRNLQAGERARIHSDTNVLPGPSLTQFCMGINHDQSIDCLAPIGWDGSSRPSVAHPR